MRSSVDLTPERCESDCVHPEQVAPLLGRTMPETQAATVAEMFSLMADPNRVRILQALGLAEELCVCDLSLLVGMNQSAVSHQLRLLRTSRVVERQKVGRLVYYRLTDPHVRHMLADGARHVEEETAS